MGIEEEVARHYGSAGIAERILAALRAAQGRRRRSRWMRLAPLDQFHGRGPVATRELVAILAAAARRAPARHRLGDRRAGALDRRQIRRSCHRRRSDAGILRGGRGAQPRDGARRPGPHHQRQRAGAAGARRRLRCGLFAKRHHEHRRQAAFYREAFRALRPGGVLALANVCAGPGGRALLPADVGGDRRDELSGDAR